MKNFSDSVIIFGAKYLIILIVFIFFLFFIKQPRDIKKKLFVFSIIFLPLVFVVAKISSLFYYDTRPFLSENFIPLIPHAADNGFPSDHTLLSSALAAAAFYFNKKTGAILFVLAILVGLSRVLAGVHHTIDIFGSIVIVAVVSFLVYKFLLPFALESKLYKRFQ